MGKEELVANLYTLRAGLSVISKQKDIVDSQQKQIDGVMAEIDKCKSEIKVLNNQINSTNYNITVVLPDELKDKKASCRSEIDEQRPSKKNTIALTIALFFIFAPALMSVSAFLLGPLTVTAVLGVVVGLVIDVSLVGLIVGLNYKVKNNKLNKRLSQKYSDLEREYDRYIADENKRLNEQKSRLKSLERQLSEYKEKNMVEAIQSYAENAHPAILLADEMRNALNAQYTPILSQSDWANIDLLIYYLSTGRADDLKEALIQYDRQRQTDEIVGAIRQAAIMVSNQIREAAFNLGKLMASCFDVLSQQLSVQHSQMMSALNTINENIIANTEAVEASLAAQVISNKELQKALSDKIDTGSQKLVADMNSMKKNLKN